MRTLILTLSGSALALFAAVAPAGPLPADTKPMAAIVKQVETAGFGPIHEISFDEGRWEVETFRGNDSVELTLDARSGKVLSERADGPHARPAPGMLPLSDLLRNLARNGHTGFSEVSFEQTYWEVETFRDGRQHELRVDPASTAVTFDHLDR